LEPAPSGKPLSFITRDGLGVSRSLDGQHIVIGDYREMYIGGKHITCATDAYVIAEIGHNHQGNLETCKEMFAAAKWAGCDAVKLQKRDNKTLYSPEMYDAPYNSENAFGATYGEHREALEFSEDEYGELKAHAEKLGIAFFATGFDIKSVDFLRQLDVPALKIASGDIANYPLLKHVATTWKMPIIFSTGGATDVQVMRAHSILDRGRGSLAVLQCTSGYPADYSELDLKVIYTYTKAFPNTTIGYSGHDTGVLAACIAYSWGARIIEKHFTLNRAWKGTDQAFSLEPQGMKKLVDDLKTTRIAIGSEYKRRHDSEIEPLKKQLKNEQGQIDGQTVPA
jgi:sialic acid synthase